MDYTMTQVQNVLRNYDSILSKKRFDPRLEELPSKQNAKVDRISVSREAVKMLSELKSSNLIDRQPKPQSGPAGKLV